MQSWSVTRLRATAALVCLMGSFGGCATVAVVEPATAVEIALTESRSGLYKAAADFCEDSREKGLATGEASLTGLAGSIFGGAAATETYAQRIRAGQDAPAGVIRKIRADAGDVSTQLGRLNIMARAMVSSGSVSREDVASFERVLIHARQGRDSLSEALAAVSGRSRAGLNAAAELAALDEALTRARDVADDLAAARTEAMPPRAPVAMTSGPVSAAG